MRNLKRGDSEKTRVSLFELTSRLSFGPRVENTDRLLRLIDASASMKNMSLTASYRPAPVSAR